MPDLKDLTANRPKPNVDDAKPKDALEGDKPKGGADEIIEKLKTPEADQKPPTDDAGKQAKEALEQILAAPKIRQMLLYEEQGIPYQILSQDQVGQLQTKEIPVDDAVPDPAQVDWDEMADSEKFPLMLKILEKKLTGGVKNLLSPVEEKFAQLEQSAQDSQIERLRQEIGVCREKYPDFDTYKRDMLILEHMHPTLPPKELYFLAKIERMEQAPPQGKVSTEKPTGVSTTQINEPEPGKPTRLGTSGFDAMIEEASDRIVNGLLQK